MTSNVKICSLNVRGLSDSEKRKDVFAWLKQKISVFTAYKIYMLDHQMRLTFSRTGDMEYV